MGQLTTRVQRLREDVGHMLDALPPTQAEIDQLRDRIANLLLRALADERHPLTDSLEELERRSELEPEGKLYRTPTHQAPTSKERRRSDPLRHLFMPHPGSADPESRRLWRLQLLLQTAARSQAHAQRMADRLTMSVPTMRRAADEAANASSVAMWSHHQYVQRLAEAIDALDSADPPLPFQLTGRDFIHVDGTKVRLSPQEAVFLSVLVNYAGKPVKRGELLEAGVRFPAHVKSRLLAKLRKAGIELQIAAAANLYSLPTSEP